ncbi:hypothetical protein [Streptomyces tendae]|uniref:hypothetical protein n=1 Tax=Streptomyces tendae TaxID=1932 RepID=UPI002492F9DC|nr:hypothetical protein [Streptomyces tendae]
MSDSLAKQLSDLRLRAGNPSLREIERLLEGEGRNRSMARSTIQDKLSGKTPLKLHQLLALVAAIAEYARQNRTPLTPQEVDDNSWRAKFLSTSKPTGTATSDPPAPYSGAGDRIMWDASPLRNAGMTDLIELMTRSQGAPLVTWLPHVAAEMFRTEMSCESLMKWASHESPQEIVQCIAALEEIFPRPQKVADDPWRSWSPANDATAEQLLREVARRRAWKNVPIIAVSLRRAGVGQYVEVFLTAMACWHLAPALQAINERLQSAALSKDALEMLRIVGTSRQKTRIMEVVHHFSELGAKRERDAILRGLASDSERFLIAIGEADEEMRRVLLPAIPWGKRSEYVDLLKSAGHNQIADQIEVPPSYSDEPPF